MKVAILPWGNVIEDYLDKISVSLESFATEMEGGWLFGYADALAAYRAEAVIVVVSSSLRKPARFTNPKTGRVTLALPSPWFFRGLSHLPLRDRLAGYAAVPLHSLATALTSEGCTHVIVQEYADPRFDRLVPLVKRLGLPVFGTFQGGQAEPQTFIGRALRKKALKQASGLIIASSDEETRVRHTHGDLRIARIFNPIDPETWFPEDRSASRASLGLPNDARIAICHCRIDLHRKGLDVLLAAWRKVAAQHPCKNLRLHLIGDGPDSDTLRAMVRAEPVPGFFWTDRFTQDRTEMRRALSAADLHVQASRHEGFAVAPMEAMACGLPTVLSRAPGALDLLEGGDAAGGRLVEIGDALALADQIAALLTDDAQRKTMAAAARAHVLSVGSLKAVGQQLTDFLRA